MLKVVGQPSLEAMLDTAMPGVIRSERALRLDAAPTEEAVIEELRALASRNTVLPQTIGLIQTRAKPQGLGIVVADLSSVATAEALTAAAGGKAIFGAGILHD